MAKRGVKISALLAVAIVTGVVFLQMFERNAAPVAATTQSERTASATSAPSATNKRDPVNTAPAMTAAAAKRQLVHSPPEAVPDGNYAELLPGLKQKSQAGDAVAAYQIATMLEDCKRMFRGQDNDEMNKRRLEKCNGVTQADLDDSVKWLQTAADAGSAEAMGAYPLYGGMDLTAQEMLKDPQAVQDYKDRSKRYLDTLVAAGSSSAMYAVAMDYENGVMLPQNSQLAYAYMFASELTSKGYVDETAFPFTKFSSSLTPEQVESAREMGRRIHAACCR